MRVYNGPPTEPPREMNVLDGIMLEVDCEYVSTYASRHNHIPVMPIAPPIFSPDGVLGAVLLPCGSVIITNASTGMPRGELSTESTTTNIEFSPLGNFLMTWSRPTAESSGNLKIWNVSTREPVCSYSQKHYMPHLIQWTLDESVCCRLVSNEVHILNGRNPEQGIIGKVHHKGLTSFQLCPIASKPYICVFCPAKGGKTGQVALYRYTTTANIPTTSALDVVIPSAVSVCNRGVMSATEASIYWSPAGLAVLIHTQSEVDSSNSSYYGASGLIILSCNGCIDGNGERDAIDPLSAAVSQGKDGHIHDVKWSPIGNVFVISAGSMPCVCTLHNQRGEQVHIYIYIYKH